MTTSVQGIPARQARPIRRTRGQYRFRYAIMGAAAIVLALIALIQAVNAYDTTYQLFRGIVEVNSSTVDAAEQALQDIAQASQAAADYALLTSDTPLYEQSQNNIFRAFSHYRDQMAILDHNLQSDDEREAYTVAETFTYSRFWRHVSNLIAQRSNDAVARREYLDADNHVRNWINPALQSLENLNYQQMVEAGDAASGVIVGRVVGFAIPAILVAALLTSISFELRRKVKRYLTPGIDVALVISYVALAMIVIQLMAASNQLKIMVGDAYQSVSASSRVLVDANLANRAESSALLDMDRADAWDARFADAAARVELRLCGQAGCAQSKFTDGRNGLLPGVIAAGQAIDAADFNIIGGISPLTAIPASNDESLALEAARSAFLDFETAHQQLKVLMAGGDTAGAIAFNTSSDAGTSQYLFDRLSAAMTRIIDLNRTVFDDIWAQEGSTLQSNRVIYGLAAYGLIVVLVGIGVWHRFREL